MCSHYPFSQVSLCTLAMGSGTVRRACESCSLKTSPPGTWCYPAAAWWKQCSLSSPMVKWTTRRTTSLPPPLQPLRSMQERDDMWPDIVIIISAWYYLLSPTNTLYSYWCTLCISLPLVCEWPDIICTHCSANVRTPQGGMHALCLVVKHICISCNTPMYSRELYYCPVNS